MSDLVTRVNHNELARTFAYTSVGPLSVEESALRRFSPRRSRWPQLAAIDERVAELDRGAAEANTTLADLRERRRTAPEHDAAAMADWIARGEKGRRPEPTAPRLDEAIAEAERRLAGFEAAAAEALEQKVRYVQKHRKRLAREADAQVEATRQRYRQAVAEAEAARDELVETRRTAVWARLYPHQSLNSAVSNAIAGGRRKPCEAAGIGEPIQPGRVFRLLEADADWAAAAVSQDQAQALGVQPDVEAKWETEEDDRRRKREFRDWYVREYGEPPPATAYPGALPGMADAPLP